MYMCSKMKGSSRKKASKNITVKNDFFRPILLTLKKKNNKIQLCYIYIYMFSISCILCVYVAHVMYIIITHYTHMWIYMDVFWEKHIKLLLPLEMP